MRVTFIIPNSGFLLDERVFPTLGVLKVAAVLEGCGHDVDVLDLSGERDPVSALTKHAMDHPDVEIVGITATMPQMPQAAQMATALRALQPQATLILGGPHVTLMQASSRQEQARRAPGRAMGAMGELATLFDVLVCGDGEQAIHLAIEPDAPALIDADDPKSPLFLTNEGFSASPMPARHLIDLDSYHYAIDGVRATSLIAQLGCLRAGTIVTLADGTGRPIEELRAGDHVICLDETSGRLSTAPIEKHWTRDADDLWTLTWDNGAVLHVTSEHPIWTRDGWREVSRLEIGAEVGFLHEVRDSYQQDGEDVSTLSKDSRVNELRSVRQRVVAQSGLHSDSQLLQSSVSGCVATAEREYEVGRVRPGGHAIKMGGDVAARADRQVEHKGSTGCGGDASCARHSVGDEARRSQPDEASRRSAEGIGHRQNEVGCILLGSDETNVGRGTNQAYISSWPDECAAEQSRAVTDSDSGGGCANVRLHRESGVLDWAVSLWNKAQSGLRRSQGEARDSAARRALAPDRVGQDRTVGLSGEGLERADRLVEGTASQAAAGATCADRTIHFARLVAKRFVGRSRVYNITVCPGHSYIANGVVVHNCPFSCAFCGGRRSPFLRKIRTRSIDSIIAEMQHLHEAYGLRGFMFFDDELNVNTSFHDLLARIVRLQSDLGVSFRLRGFLKAELLTEPMARGMVQAGFRQVLVGFESGHPRILANIKKQATVEDNTRAVDILHGAGLQVKAAMSIGHPGESRETIAASKRWLLQVQPDEFDVSVITVYPGTPYFDDAVETDRGWTYTDKKTGDRLHAKPVDQLTDVNFYKGIKGQYQSFVSTDFLSGEDICEARDTLEDEVRQALSLPYPTSAAAVQHEHSMGMR